MRQVLRSSRPRNRFLSIRKGILLTFFIVSAVAISLTLIYLVSSTLHLSARFQVLLGLVLTIASTLLGAVLTVLLEIPNIGTEFDKIKDDIQNRTIRDPEEFSRRLVRLLCDFLTFSFLDVHHAFMWVANEGYVFSSPNLANALDEAALEEILERSEKTEEVFLFRRVKFEEKDYFLYIVPIVFGGSRLGYFGVFTSRRLWTLFQSFLGQFENDYVDDQLVHVLDIKKQRLQKQFYRDMDVFSNKITRRQYGALEEYQRDVLGLLLRTTGGRVGVFITCYSEEAVVEAAEGARLDEEELRRLTGRPIPAESGIVSDPNLRHHHVYAMPVFIEEVQGVVFLVAADRDGFEYFDGTLREIEDVKLDNDLENLAQLLNLKPCRRLEVGGG